MSCVSKIEVEYQEVFNKLKELTNGHSSNALLLYLNLLNKGVDLSKHTVTQKDLEIVPGKKINFQAQFSVESFDVGTTLSDDEANYITKDGKKLKRVSNISEEVAPLKFRSPEDKAQSDIREQNEGLFNENMKYQDRSYRRDGTYKVEEEIPYLEYVERIKARRDAPRQEGKIKHKFLESLLKPSLIVERELNELVDLFKVSAEQLSKWKKEILSKVFPIFDKMDKSKISSEVLLTMAEAGVAGTVDILLNLGDGLYSIYDLKTGKLNDGKAAFMKYVDRQRYPIIGNSLNKNKLSTMMYAVMLKYNKPDARFQDIQIVDGEGKLVDVEILPFLYIIGEYFRDTNRKFYEENKHLFDAANYVTDTLALQEAKKKENYKDTMFKSLYKSLLNHIKGIKSKDDLSLIEATRLVLEDLSGFDMIGAGHKIKTGFLEKNFSNVKNISDPILQQLSKLFLKGDQAVREEMNSITAEYNKRMAPVLIKIKKARGNFGSDYKTEWAFAWDDGNMTTWKSAKWDTLTKAEQNLMDYHRWMIRFSLFSSMNPRKGIKYIESELAARDDLKASDIVLLEKQISDLMSLDSIDKFKLDQRFVKYYEGWTPRVYKTDEEQGNMKDYLTEKFKSNFALTDLDDLRLIENNDFSALPLRGLGGKDSVRMQVEGEYTFNGELVFNHFVASAVRKKHLDNAMALAMGIKAYLQMSSEGLKKDPQGENALSWLDSIVKAALYQEIESQGPESFKVAGKEYSTKKTAMTLRNYISVISMGLNFPGMIKSSMGMSWVNNANALAGSIAKAMFGAVKVDTDLQTIVQAKGDYIALESLHAQGKIEESKLYQLSRLMGFQIDSYNYDRFNTDVLKSVRDLPKWASYDTIFMGYRLGDRYNNYVNLAAQLRSIKVGGKSMWDHYQIVNGELEYTGPVRGVDSAGNTITGLTSMEMSTLKYKSEQLFGSYRVEERMPFQNGAITGALMQFKAFWPAIIRRALKSPGTAIGLTEMMETEEYMVVDPKHPDYRKKFSKNSPEFAKYEKDDVRILPVLLEVSHSEEGYLISMLTGLHYFYLKVRRPEGVDLEMYNLSDYQKKNVAYGLGVLTTHLSLMLLMALIFGAKGDDDEIYKNNPIVKAIRKSPMEVAGVAQLIIDRNSMDSMTGIPVISKSFKATSGLLSMMYDLSTGRRIETGINEGDLHGTKDFLAITPINFYLKFKEALSVLVELDEE
jgi:hypothetical protein